MVMEVIVNEVWGSKERERERERERGFEFREIK